MKQQNDDITPLWATIPSFFLLPLKGSGLFALLLFSVLLSFTLSIPIFFLISLPVFIMTSILVLKYGLEVLQSTSDGRLDAPNLNEHIFNTDNGLPLKQLFIFALPAFLLSFLDSAGFPSVFSMLFTFFYMFILPASIMTLAYSHSFFAAINPTNLFFLIRSVGWTYAVLYGFLFLLNGSTLTLFRIIAPEEPGLAYIFIFFFLQIYFAWVMYAMMGYVMYQHHDDLGYDVPDDDDAIEETPQDIVLNELDQLIEDDQYDAAKELLISSIKEEPEDLALRQKFHNLIKIMGETKQLTIHGKEVISRAIPANKLNIALNVYLDCLKVDPDFKPKNAADYLPLATEMRKTRRFKESILLINGFHKQYPDNPNIPPLYLMVAKIFVEDLSQDEKAAPILSFLKKQYPEHEVNTDVDLLIQFLDKVKTE